MLSYVQTIPNTAKLQKWSNYDENDKKCWVTFKPFQTQQNYKSDQITMKTIKIFEILPKPFETQQNYKSNQIKMNCIDLTSKRSKI